MIEESARVMRVDGDIVWIEALRQSACNSCDANNSCGHSLLAKMGQKSIQAPAQRNGIVVSPNDQVIIGVPEDAILRSSLTVYGVPLIAMIITTVMASAFQMPESIMAALAFASLIIGFMAVSIRSRKFGFEKYQPKILRTLSSNKNQIPVCELSS